MKGRSNLQFILLLFFSLTFLSSSLTAPLAFSMGKKPVEPTPPSPPDSGVADSGADEETQKKFPILSKAFAHPTDILTTPSLAATLHQLEKIAEPSTDYHEELLFLAKEAKIIDFEHLNLLVSASYVTWGEAENFKKEGKAEEYRLSLLLGAYTNRIIDIALPKTDSISPEKETALLKRLFPVGEATKAFQWVYNHLLPLSAADQLAFIDFSVTKEEDVFAGTAALNYFIIHCSHQADSLLNLSLHLKSSGKDILIKGAIPLLPALTLAEVTSLSKAAYWSGQTIALLGMDKIVPLGIPDILGVLQLVTGHNKDMVIQSGLDRLKSLTTLQLLDLSNRSFRKREEFLIKYNSKISDLNVSNVVLLAQNMTGPNKDTFIKNYLSTLLSVSSQDLARLAKASYWLKESLIVSNLDKVSDYHTTQAIFLATQVSGNYKDEVISHFIQKQTQLSTSEILALSDACFRLTHSVLLSSIEKISDLTAPNAILTVKRLKGSDKDTYLLSAVDRVIHLNTSNLRDLASQAYLKGDEVLARGRKRLGI